MIPTDAAGLLIVPAVLIGVVAGSILGCVPSVHGYAALAATLAMLQAAAIPADVALGVLAGSMAGFAMFSSLPAVLLAAPDESALWTVEPGQRYLARGRAYEAVALTGVGGLAGIALVVAVAAVAGPRLTGVVHDVAMPHGHWILPLLLGYMALTEPPPSAAGLTRRQRLGAWLLKTCAVVLVLLLAGGLGLALWIGRPLAANAPANLAPAMVGLFAVPGLLLNAIAPVAWPRQRLRRAPANEAPALAPGLGAGLVGGAVAAMLPGATGAAGGFLAGRLAGRASDGATLAMQGAAKMVFYLGSFLLALVPGLGRPAGGAAALVHTLGTPGSWYEYRLALGATAVGGVAAWALLGPVSRGAIAVMQRWSGPRLSRAALAVAPIVVALGSGVGGLAVLVIATAIGLLPILLGCRRVHCTAAPLAPLAWSLAGA